MRPLFTWRLRTRELALGERTLVMGVLNVTPDSFSDGGRYADRDAAVAHGIAMRADGADLVDVGCDPGDAWPGVGEAVLSLPFYIMTRLQGESIGRRIVKEAALAAARAVLPRQLGQALAVIHRIPIDGPGLAFLRRPPPELAVVPLETQAILAAAVRVTGSPAARLHPPAHRARTQAPAPAGQSVLL